MRFLFVILFAVIAMAAVGQADVITVENRQKIRETPPKKMPPGNVLGSGLTREQLMNILKKG
ncbi:hypothetical protein PRIPAC_78149 [Pristionchus pacificus]|uniref:Uncharacterized protein n=1 Tax=Pristionchus pacificus TaxID=54126 RepID=A0A454XY13_PRIPA|nr:hypothetical protein PRIPAC_78149 [Pristionchus pacificus]|eukprot:PDM78463.1 hypothetical protein PRIPAC_31042 [Pristionchus pacificus]